MRKYTKKDPSYWNNKKTAQKTVENDGKTIIIKCTCGKTYIIE